MVSCMIDTVIQELHGSTQVGYAGLICCVKVLCLLQGSNGCMVLSFAHIILEIDFAFRNMRSACF